MLLILLKINSKIYWTLQTQCLFIWMVLLKTIFQKTFAVLI